MKQKGIFRNRVFFLALLFVIVLGFSSNCLGFRLVTHERHAHIYFYISVLNVNEFVTTVLEATCVHKHTEMVIFTLEARA